MRAGELSLAIEIPPGFARDLARGRPVQIGAWIDGAMPSRAEIVRGYVQGMHAHWLGQKASSAPGRTTRGRSEERRVGTECVRPCRYRWSMYHKTNKTAQSNKQAPYDTICIQPQTP